MTPHRYEVVVASDGERSIKAIPITEADWIDVQRQIERLTAERDEARGIAERWRQTLMPTSLRFNWEMNP